MKRNYAYLLIYFCVLFLNLNNNEKYWQGDTNSCHSSASNKSTVTKRESLTKDIERITHLTSNSPCRDDLHLQKRNEVVNVNFFVN